MVKNIAVLKSKIIRNFLNTINDLADLKYLFDTYGFDFNSYSEILSELGYDYELKEELYWTEILIVKSII